MNFTAKWCLTCKANEQLVFDTAKFKNFIRRKKKTLLRADWTRRDPEIESFLKSHGYVGIPAYFIQKPSGELLNLGEFITFPKIKRH